MKSPHSNDGYTLLYREDLHSHYVSAPQLFIIITWIRRKWTVFSLLSSLEERYAIHVINKLLGCLSHSISLLGSDYEWDHCCLSCRNELWRVAYLPFIMPILGRIHLSLRYPSEIPFSEENFEQYTNNSNIGHFFRRQAYIASTSLSAAVILKARQKLAWRNCCASAVSLINVSLDSFLCENLFMQGIF